MLCNHHHDLFPKLFHHPRQKLWTLHAKISYTPFLQALINTSALSVPMNLSILDISYILYFIQYLSLCVWLLPGFIPVVACIRTSFLLTAEYPIVCSYHILFMHLSADGHLDCFYLLAIVNKAAMNTGLQVPVWVLLFNSFECLPGVELPSHRVILRLTFCGTAQLFSTGTVPFYIPTAGDEGFNLSRSLPTLVISIFFL